MLLCSCVCCRCITLSCWQTSPQLLEELSESELAQFIRALGENSSVRGFQLFARQRTQLAQAAAAKLDSMCPRDLISVMLAFCHLGWSDALPRSLLWQHVRGRLHRV